MTLHIFQFSGILTPSILQIKLTLNTWSSLYNETSEYLGPNKSNNHKPSTKSRVHDLDNYVRIVFNFRSGSILQSHFMRPFEDDRFHSIFRHCAGEISLAYFYSLQFSYHISCDRLQSLRC